MINRKKELQILSGLLERHRVVGIIGARQVGKTTIAKDMIKQIENANFFFDLENPEDLARLSDPMLTLKDLTGLIIIDEIQRQPNLFPVLRVLADKTDIPKRFLILGSASPELLKQSSQTLAGRIFYHQLDGFSVEETGIKNYKRLWLRGGFPRAFLAESDLAANEWLKGFIRTFLERDIPQLGINIRSETLRRFWTMLAHYHGQTFNASEFGRSFGVADTTVRNYLDVLISALVVKQLKPWHENISKRQVKAPKIYLTDSGLVHNLLNIRTIDELESHPKLGASWEGFVIGNLIRQLNVDYDECFYWGTHGGAELDLLVIRGQKRWGFEIKRTSSPKVTPSMLHALSDLKLEQLDIIHAGEYTFPLKDKIRAVAFTRIMDDVAPVT